MLKSSNWCIMLLLTNRPSFITFFMTLSLSTSTNPYQPQQTSAGTMATTSYKMSLLHPPITGNGNRPDCANDEEDYCERDSNYPTDTIRKIMQLRYIPPPQNPTFETLQIRFGNNAPGCASVQKSYFPRVVKSTKKSAGWVYVPNFDNYVQKLDMIRCQSVAEACSDSVPLGYTSVCKQRMSQAKVVAIDPTSKTPYQQTVDLPSGCDCQLGSLQFLLKSNINDSQTQPHSSTTTTMQLSTSYHPVFTNGTTTTEQLPIWN